MTGLPLDTSHQKFGLATYNREIKQVKEVRFF